MREYHDKERDRVRHASRDQQEEYYRLRGNVVAAVNRNLEGVAEEFPQVGRAVADLERFMRQHSARVFEVGEEEDHYPGEFVWVR